MHVVQVRAHHHPRQFKMSEDFLTPYRKKGDPFQSLLARSTYLTKYCRDVETWTDTIRRTVEGNMSLVSNGDQTEAELLFHLFWTGQALPPGRSLWVGGVEGIPADARFNCWYVTLRSIDDWCWAANQLMLGGGVGVGLGEISCLPGVADLPSRLAIWCRSDHENVAEVTPNDKTFLNGQTPVFAVPDSREGWVEALRLALRAAFEGTDLIIDVSEVRPRGRPIRIFGGTACGPGPLTHLLRNAWSIVHKARGRRLTSVECLDVTNHIGLCIKSGNVRRSALIALGDATDHDFRDAKKDWEAVKSHRHTSNNSIAFRTWEEISSFDWHSLVADMTEYGEPGILNLPLVWRTDPSAEGVNPCFAAGTLIAVADGRNAVPIEQLAEEGCDVPVYSMNKQTGRVEIKMGRHPRVTGHHKRLVRVWLDDGGYVDTTSEHKFILMDGTSIEAQALEPGMSLPRFTKSLEPVKEGSKDYFRVYCNTRDSHKDKIFEHRLIARFYAPAEWDRVYEECHLNGFAHTGGLVVHHKNFDQLDNRPDNLQIMTFEEHSKLHGGLSQSGENNGRWLGVSNDQVREHALSLTRQLGRRFSLNDWDAYALSHGLPRQFSKYRTQHLGTVLGLAQSCAAELGLEYTSEDPRVVATYQSMLSQGYDAQIVSGKVLVRKVCEHCGSGFQIEHSFRERCFCSEVCGNAYVNSDLEIKACRMASINATHSQRMEKTKSEQARIYSGLKFDLGQAPNRKQWSLACKEGGLPSRIGPTLKHGFRSFQEVAAAGDGYNHKVVRVEELPGEHTVYNITVDDFHTVSVVSSCKEKRGVISYTGVFVSNCGEQALHNREACNLAEVFPANFEPGTDSSLPFKLVTRYTLRQRLTPLSDALSQDVGLRNMRIGVSLGGICDFEWSNHQLATWYTACRGTADNYADELGVAHPITTTTVKPSGTISLLNGSSPGIHAPHAPFYLRRVRIAKNDRMVPAMVDAGVPFEYDVYDKTGNTLVFAFPMKAIHTKVTVQSQSLRDQFERQAAVQEWWADNAVSSTLSFSDDEKDELADCLKEFVPRLKSTSCLARAHGYAQAPYEEIDETSYRALYATIQHDHPLVAGGEMDDGGECAGGVCPLR